MVARMMGWSFASSPTTQPWSRSTKPPTLLHEPFSSLTWAPRKNKGTGRSGRKQRTTASSAQNRQFTAEPWPRSTKADGGSPDHPVARARCRPRRRSRWARTPPPTTATAQRLGERKDAGEAQAGRRSTRRRDDRQPQGGGHRPRPQLSAPPPPPHRPSLWFFGRRSRGRRSATRRLCPKLCAAQAAPPLGGGEDGAVLAYRPAVRGLWYQRGSRSTWWAVPDLCA